MDALMLPLNWQRVRLGDIFFITAGGDLSKPHYSNTKQSDFNYPIYSNAIEKKGLCGYSSFFIIKNKSITITARGTIGVAFFRDYPYVPIGRLLVLQPKISNIDCRFYAEYINSKVKFNTEQTTIPQLTIPKVALCEIPLPPLNEQIAIADILSALDNYLHALRVLILKKESVKKALSFELLSQRKRLKGFNQAWQRVRLGDILSYEQPTKYLVATTQYLQKGFTPILTAGKTFILGYTNDKHGIYTNIPVIIFDDFTTDSKMVNFPFKVKSSAIKILSLRDNNQADLKYIYEKLTLLKHQVTDHKRYWIDEFSNFEIPLPPLNEQIAIADILSALDKEIASLKNKKRQFENIKKALNHDLMSAKIRVLKK
ncbi:restriction endonuclease subunit S [Helicobacter pylori]|uniref:restriction endonuclease subunit S n=1 Tax=Helicobacter pylori TaxID=210 RepID=UPI00038E371E|nr:restriction endonuclease subunit S [Helicobacter pylori]EQL70301.1 hypothetical protein N407_00520 [Helicobacter pylori FD662]